MMAFSFVLGRTEAQRIVFPRVGEPMPDYVLKNVTHYKKKTASFDEFRGKWLLINFWTASCKMCIFEMPQIRDISVQFKDQLEVLFVGCDDPKVCFGEGLEETYEGLRRKMDLNFISAYESELFAKWDWYTFPLIVILDDKGVVRVLTDGRDLTGEKIQRLLKNQPVDFFFEEVNDKRPRYQNEKDLVVFESSLTRWNGGGRTRVGSIGDFIKSGSNRFIAKRIPLYYLYNLAYTGFPVWMIPRDSLYHEFALRPIIATKDSALFQFNYESGAGYYDYQLTLSKKGLVEEEIKEHIQEQLKSIFGFKVTIEKRELPVWKLTASDNARKSLPNRDGKWLFTDRSASGGVAGFKAKNMSMTFFLGLVKGYLDDHKYPYIDETGINEKIDITMDALMTDFDEVRAALKRNGLDLVLDKKLMNVIIISDADSTATKRKL